MTDARLENLLRGALREDPPEGCDSAIAAEILGESARRRRRAAAFRWMRGAAAAIVVAMLAVAPGLLRGRATVVDDEPEDCEIMLEIIGLASPADFYAEE